MEIRWRGFARFVPESVSHSSSSCGPSCSRTNSSSMTSSSLTMLAVFCGVSELGWFGKARVVRWMGGVMVVCGVGLVDGACDDDCDDELLVHGPCARGARLGFCRTTTSPLSA